MMGINTRFAPSHTVISNQKIATPFFDPLNHFMPAPSSDALAATTCVPGFHIVLVEPEIPPNTGSIARLCGATNSTLHLVHPLGFSTDNKHLKRAGLDYWPHVQVVHWPDLHSFLAAQAELRLHFFTTKSRRTYTEACYQPGDMLIFGRETKGLPEEILALYSERCLTIPMRNAHIRSLNLAMAAGIVLYEAIRQQEQQK
jgi:tRNA (cytidine/uridine-2'-O-)-methyltransferase